MYKKDRKIIYELDKNAHIPFSQIAKNVSLSPETVRYRVNKLINERIIKYFITIINLAIIGRSYYEVFIKLQNYNNKIIKDIIDFLSKEDLITWVGTFEGDYDLGFIVTPKKQNQLDEIMFSFYDNFSSYIMKKSISINIKGDFLPRDYLVDKKRDYNSFVSYNTLGKTIVLDEIDEKICKYLAKNARIPYIEIANKLNLSIGTIINRIKKLRKSNVIIGTYVVLNNEKINQLHYKILIYLTNLDKEKLNKLNSFLISNKRVIAIIKTLSEWDMEIDLELESVTQLKDFITSMIDKFYEIIKEHKILRVTNMPKYNFFL